MNYYATELLGVEFTLLENGDVLWNYSENFEGLPLLECDTYEVLRERDNFAVFTEILLRFGAWKGLYQTKGNAF